MTVRFLLGRAHDGTWRRSVWVVIPKERNAKSFRRNGFRVDENLCFATD